MKNKGVSNILSFATISLVILIIGFSVYYIVLQQFKSGGAMITSEERKAESKLEEKLSLIYWGVDGVIVANDGENKITITKIYLDNQIIITNIIINPDEKKQINIPYGENLMFESSSGNLIKLEKPKPTITEPYYYSETQGSQSQQQTQSYSKTTYTSTITTEIPIQTYSYRTTTSTSLYPISTITSYYIEPTYPYRVIYYTSTIFSTYKYTLTFASPYTTTKTTTYTTTIDPIIKNANPIFDNPNTLLISIFLLVFIFVYSIIFNHYLRRLFYEEK